MNSPKSADWTWWRLRRKHFPSAPLGKTIKTISNYYAFFMYPYRGIVLRGLQTIQIISEYFNWIITVENKSNWPYPSVVADGGNLRGADHLSQRLPHTSPARLDD